MRAWVVDRPGPSASLRLAEIPSPWRSATRARRDVEVLVRVEAVGLNLADRTSTEPGDPAWHYPHVPGTDIAGRVVAVHADAAARREVGWMLPAPGDRVVLYHDVRESGGFAQYVAVPPEALAVIPPSLDPIAAASLPTPGLTALDAVERRLRQLSGHTVLISGDVGGVAGFAVQLAKLFGAKVIAGAPPELESAARALGALHVVDDRAADFTEQLALVSPGGLDAVIDAVSARSATTALSLLRHAGHLVSVAGRPDFATIPECALTPTVSEVALGSAYTHGGFEGRRWLSRGLERLMGLIIEGHLHPPEIRVIGFEDIPEALEELADGAGSRRVVANLRWE